MSVEHADHTGGVRRWTKLRIAAQVVLAAVLAVAAALMAIEAAEWKYVRADLSVTGRNTLDPAIAELVEQLPGDVAIDVFFRPLQPPYDGVSLDAQGRFLELLFIAQNARRDRLDVTVHDLGELEVVQARQLELGVQGTNIVVFSSADRRATLSLYGDIADVDWGNPTMRMLKQLVDEGIDDPVDGRTYNPDPNAFVPAQLVAFRGGEAIAASLKKVSADRAPRVYLSEGHGEPRLQGTLASDMSKLVEALERDGFDVDTWNGTGGGPVPADCEVLAVLGPQQPLRATELIAIRDYVDAGGRLIAAPSYEEVDRAMTGGVGDLLQAHGMLPEAGIVCEPFTGPSGQKIDGGPACADFLVGGRGLSTSYPLTETLGSRGQRLRFSLTTSLRRGQPSRGTLVPLVVSSADSWRDVPRAEFGAPDFAYDRATEKKGPFSLVMVAEFPTMPGNGAAPGQARVLGVAGSNFFANGLFDSNRDFIVNAFNWMAERDYRIGVSPRDPGVSLLDVRQGSAMVVLGWLVRVAIPGLAMLIGAVLWRGRRG